MVWISQKRGFLSVAIWQSLRIQWEKNCEENDQWVSQENLPWRQKKVNEDSQLSLLISCRCWLSYCVNGSSVVPQFVQAAITKYHRLGGLKTKQNKTMSHSSIAWKSEIRAPEWSGSSGDLLCGCRLLTSCCVLMWRKKQGNSLGSFL